MFPAGLEAVMWCALGILAPALVRRWWPHASRRLGEWSRELEKLGPWLHGILPAYLALISGAVLERDAGIQRHAAGNWIAGVFACGMGLVAAFYWLRRRPPVGTTVPEAWRAALDEPRWALYRAAGILWTGSQWVGVAAGAGLMIVEWALIRRPWQGLLRLEQSAWIPLLRGLASSLYFVCTWNLWLTMATQTGIVLLIRRSRPVS